MMYCSKLTGKLTVTEQLSCTMKTSPMSGKITVVPVIDNPPAYLGDTEFYPNETMQIIPCAKSVMAEDIIIHPIPPKYGKIAWNGVTLTVY